MNCSLNMSLDEMVLDEVSCSWIHHHGHFLTFMRVWDKNQTFMSWGYIYIAKHLYLAAANFGGFIFLQILNLRKSL